MGPNTALAEFLPGLLQSCRRGVGIHTQQTGRYGYGLGLDLGVPQHALGESREGLERTLGELAVFRRHGLRRAHTATPGRFPEIRQHRGYPVLRGPCLDDVPHGHQELGAQGHGGPGAPQAFQHLLEGGGGDHGGDVRRGSEADDRVVVRRLPVSREQQRHGVGELALRLRSEEGGEALVGFPGSGTGARRIRGTRRVGVCTERFPSKAQGVTQKL